MEADSPGGRAAQRAHGLRRCDSRSKQSADCLYSALRPAAHTLEFHFRTRGDRRVKRRGKLSRKLLAQNVHAPGAAVPIHPDTAPPHTPPKPEEKTKPPKPPVCQRLLLGTDGGLYQSFAGGRNWDDLSKIPAGEFYRICL